METPTQSDATTHTHEPYEPTVWEAAFLIEVSQHGNTTQAVETIGIDRSTPYDRKEAHPEFARRWKYAKLEAADRLEAEARRRAVEGVEEPVYGRVGKDQDGLIGTVRKYSDTLLIQLLRANKPEKFKDRVANELTGKNGGPVQMENNVMLYMPQNGRDPQQSDTEPEATTDS